MISMKSKFMVFKSWIAVELTLILVLCILLYAEMYKPSSSPMLDTSKLSLVVFDSGTLVLLSLLAVQTIIILFSYTGDKYKTLKDFSTMSDTFFKDYFPNLYQRALDLENE